MKKLGQKIYQKLNNQKTKIVDEIKCKKNIDNTYNTFSIVTATYNCEFYLEDYFLSILNNNYDLNKIQIIIIDDGSIDNSKDIINKYKNKLNIDYIFQNNSGQAIARNNGITFAKNDWITFIDADDFINENYFSEVNNAINIFGIKSIYSTRYVKYIEKTNNKIYTHPLDYKYQNKQPYIKRNLINNPKYIQLAVNSVFLPNNDELKKINFKNIKPQFEDAFYIAEFLLKSRNYNITFIKNAEYFYRQRENESSTLNKAYYKKEKYVDLLNDAYINLLKMYKSELNKIPKFIQSMVIYDLSWNIKDLESSKVKLDSNEINLREKYMQEIFSNIEFKNIVYNWKWMWKLYQIGINNRYYNNKENVLAGAYYQNDTNNYLKLQLLSIDENWSFHFLNKIIKLKDLEYRKVPEIINQKNFLNRYYVYIPKEYGEFKLKYNNKAIDITFKENIKNIKRNFTPENTILFFDRFNKADDNAEVFYEYIKNNNPEYKNIYFVIQKNSNCYQRLKDKNFNLIDYNSKEFIEYYKKADYIVSSALDRSIENYENLRYSKSKSKANFIWLQHGIITDDLSQWLLGKKIDKMVVSASFEYKNLIQKYNLIKEEVLFTTLPRYDKLYNQEKNIILVQFTWRMQYQNLNTNQLMETEYYQNIVKILKDSTLIEILKQNNFELHFIPHPQFNEHFNQLREEYTNNQTIKVLDTNNVIFRDLFATAKLMITDYSSVFNDFAYLKKPVIYYQYDEEDFFKYHLYKKEMDYKSEGLGPVAQNHNDLIQEIIKNIKKNFILDKIYLDRINNFFQYSEESNCQKLFAELTSYSYFIDKEKNVVNITIEKINKEQNMQGIIKLKIGNKEIYNIDVSSDKDKIYYNNIIIPESLIIDKYNEVKIYHQVKNSKIDIKTTKKTILNEYQKKYNEKYNIIEENGLFFSQTINKKSKKIIFTFGGYNHFDAEIRYPISYLKDFHNNELISVVAFQDFYFTDGTYYLVDNNGEGILTKIENKIKQICLNLNLEEKDIIFYGASKGGTTAIQVSSNFKNATVIINAPQIIINNFLNYKTHHKGLVCKYLEYNNIKNYSVEDKLKQTIDNNKVYYGYSSYDKISNCNIIENLEHPNLDKVDYKCPHREVAQNAYNNNKEIILKKVSEK